MLLRVSILCNLYVSLQDLSVVVAELEREVEEFNASAAKVRFLRRCTCHLHLLASSLVRAFSRAQAAADLTAAESGLERLAEEQRGALEGSYKTLADIKEALGKELVQRTSAAVNKRKAIDEETKTHAAIQQQSKSGCMCLFCVFACLRARKSFGVAQF